MVKADGTAVWTEPATPWPSPDWAPAGEVIASLRDGNIQLDEAATGAHTRTFMSMATGLAVHSYTWIA